MSLMLCIVKNNNPRKFLRRNGSMIGGWDSKFPTIARPNFKRNKGSRLQ